MRIVKVSDQNETSRDVLSIKVVGSQLVLPRATLLLVGAVCVIRLLVSLLSFACSRAKNGKERRSCLKDSLHQRTLSPQFFFGPFPFRKERFCVVVSFVAGCVCSSVQDVLVVVCDVLVPPPRTPPLSGAKVCLVPPSAGDLPPDFHHHPRRSLVRVSPSSHALNGGPGRSR